MSAGSVFALPVPSATRRHILLQPKSARKRRRNGQHIVDLEVDEHTNDATRATSDEPQSVEYTAVVTPAERSQRRLAGWPLNQEPPPLPFPHASPHTNAADGQQRKAGIAETLNKGRETIQRKHTLHLQHLAAMTALLHRSMTAQDYSRAARALGLLLRNRVNGHSIDIRHAGLWGIGAEVLLLQGDGQDPAHDDRGQHRGSITWGGFERAKLFYERLIVQYPLNKTWPGSINALDFSTAMFGLWIYVVNHESRQMQERAMSQGSIDADDEVTSATEWKTREWELEQARQIADAMDVRMRDITFNGFPELIQQRAMVALWIADLIDTHVRPEEDEKPQSDQDDEDLSRRIESITFDRHNSPQPQSASAEIEENKALARRLLRKARKFTGEGEETEDEED